MGLDMYLKAEKHTSAYDFASDEEKNFYNKLCEVLGANTFRDKDIPITSLKITIGYWRKANAIHKRFVDNVQDGVDECQESYVPREYLQKLKERCLEVLSDPTKASELFPPQAGFFFGDTDINDWYFSDLRHTVEIIDRVMENLPEIWEIYYQSSW